MSLNATLNLEDALGMCWIHDSIAEQEFVARGIARHLT